MDIYGVIGWPVKHTLSPYMHNAAFEELGIDAEYLSFEIQPHNLGTFLKGIFKAGIKGLNVTVPHKEKCMDFLDSIDPLARSIGAVNTVVVKANKLHGYNTDSYGFIAALKKDLGFEIKGKSVFVLGSGGASRAVSFSLAANRAKEIILTDLFLGRIKLLAENVRKFYPACRVDIVKPKKIYRGEDLRGADLLVNATPIGLNKSDPFLFDKGIFRKGLAVYDLVYNPKKTILVETAKKGGLKASGGVSMLLYQGAKSFELWTGKKAPIGIMRNALKKALRRHF